MDEATKLLRELLRCHDAELNADTDDGATDAFEDSQAAREAARAYLQAPAAEAPTHALTDEDRATLNAWNEHGADLRPNDECWECLRRVFAAGRRAAQVPREPTQEMICAGLAECELDLNKNLISLPRRIWRAMYDAAPPAPPDQARDAARLERLLDEANARVHTQSQRFNALCLALKTHAGDTDGYEFGLGRVQFKNGDPVSFIWATQVEIDAAIDAAIAAQQQNQGERE